MSFWNLGSDCLRCNNSGYIPVISGIKKGERFIPIEEIYMCNCEKAHEYFYFKEKEIIDEDSGKRKKTRIKNIISVPFDSVFSEFQFKWTDEIMKSRNPYIDYHEVYFASMNLVIKNFNLGYGFNIITDFKYLENQKGLGFSELKEKLKRNYDNLTKKITENIKEKK